MLEFGGLSGVTLFSRTALRGFIWFITPDCTGAPYVLGSPILTDYLQFVDNEVYGAPMNTTGVTQTLASVRETGQPCQAASFTSTMVPVQLLGTHSFVGPFRVESSTDAAEVADVPAFSPWTSGALIAVLSILGYVVLRR
jgi:hypothetical protein